METVHTIKGKDKDGYLLSLDKALDALTQQLEREKIVTQSPSLRAFGDEHKWDWERLPGYDATYQTLARFVRRVQEEYRWFDWQLFPQTPHKNRGYFDEVGVSAASGLPWLFNFTTLHRLKNDAATLLARMPHYESTAQDLSTMLLEDYVAVGDIATKAEELHRSAMRRSFLEHLQKATLLGWEATDFSLKPVARKVIALGGETLWNIAYLQYDPASSMFEIYIIDAWQDIREPQITESEPGRGSISQDLVRSFKFGKDNAAWYILKTLDEKFPSLHPVHVTRALIGPFETKYLTKPEGIKPLPVTADILAHDPQAGLLRFSRQYAYAPNHNDRDGVTRQVVYREHWADEFIVCPTRYAPKVSASVLGTHVRIIPM